MKSLRSNSPTYFIPSKTFLWGEYSALKGGTAGLVATEPCFVFSKSEIICDEKKQVMSQPFEFHPQSPAGRWILFIKDKLNLDEQQIKDLFSCHLYDPHHGEGGFGRSTAELVYIAQSFSERLDMDIQTLWELYRELSVLESDKKWPPSGYDLVVQWHPSFSLLQVVGDQIRFKEKPWPFTRLGFLIFKTKKKVFTHLHLKELTLEVLDPLVELSSRVTDQYMQEDQAEFMQSLGAFRDQLVEFNLVCEETLNTVSRLQALQGVEFAKGCGALGADVVAVFCKKQYKNQVLKQVSEVFGDELRFVADEDRVIFGR